MCIKKKNQALVGLKPYVNRRTHSGDVHAALESSLCLNLAALLTKPLCSAN
jgi:hypothetical protein